MNTYIVRMAVKTIIKQFSIVGLLALVLSCGGGESSNPSDSNEISTLTGLLATDCPSGACSSGGISETNSLQAEDLRLQWVARHGMSSAEYQSQFELWTSVGFRPVDITGYIESGGEQFAAVWEKTTGPAWVARHNLSSSEYQTEFETLAERGFYPVRVSGYTGLNGEAKFAAIWEATTGNQSRARHNMSSDQYQQEVEQGIEDGFQVVQVSGYTDLGQSRFAAIWERDEGFDWVARHNMTSEMYQQEFDTWVGNGYRLTHVDGYERAGQQNYAAVWQKVEGPDRYAQHGMSAANYQSEFDNQIYLGRHPVRITAFTINNNAVFAAIWEDSGLSGADRDYIDNTVSSLLEAYDVPGLSIAIAKDERLVFAKGYGFADESNNWRASPKQLFRIASVSKPVTATGIMKLIERNQLSLDEKVFGTDRILEFDIPECVENSEPIRCVEDITVQHLLEHSAGAWENLSGMDPMFLNSSFSQSELIQWTLDNQPLLSVPGSSYRYSNFGYSLLGRVIEAKTGSSYESFMQGLLRSAGITDMHVAGDERSDKRSNEVVYYPGNTDAASRSDPYGMEVRRMDSHGGWLASAVDLARFCVASDNKPGKTNLLGAAAMQTMLTVSTASGANRYAKGWWVSGDIWWHGGVFNGLTSMLVKWEGYCWAVLANTRQQGLSLAIDDLPKTILWGEDKNSSTGGGVSQWPAYDLF